MVLLLAPAVRAWCRCSPRRLELGVVARPGGSSLVSLLAHNRLRGIGFARPLSARCCCLRFSTASAPGAQAERRKGEERHQVRPPSGSRHRTPSCLFTLGSGLAEMVRTNVEIDDELVGEAMRRHGCTPSGPPSTWPCVSPVGAPMTREGAPAMEGPARTAGGPGEVGRYLGLGRVPARHRKRSSSGGPSACAGRPAGPRSGSGVQIGPP